jgi:hypothetical protein
MQTIKTTIFDTLLTMLETAALKEFDTLKINYSKNGYEKELKDNYVKHRKHAMLKEIIMAIRKKCGIVCDTARKCYTEWLDIISKDTPLVVHNKTCIECNRTFHMIHDDYMKILLSDSWIKSHEFICEDCK